MTTFVAPKALGPGVLVRFLQEGVAGMPARLMSIHARKYKHVQRGSTGIYLYALKKSFDKYHFNGRHYCAVLLNEEVFEVCSSSLESI